MSENCDGIGVCLTGSRKLIINFITWSLVSKNVLTAMAQCPEFESRYGHIWRMFHLWLRFITVGVRSAHLVHHVHKSGRKTLLVIIIDGTVYYFLLILRLDFYLEDYICPLTKINIIPCLSKNLIIRRISLIRCSLSGDILWLHR